MAKSNFDKFLKEYGGDNQISGTDIKDATKAGYSADQLSKFTKKADKEGLESGTSTQKQLNNIGGSFSPSSSSGAAANTPPGATTTDFDIDNYKDLATFQHTLDKDRDSYGYASDQIIAGIQGEANKAVAATYAGATKYGWDAQIDIAGITSASEERWRKYMADQDRLKAENVANIQGGYSLDLQTIVNAGAVDVANIQGEYGLEGLKLQGEYGLESDRIKGDTARDVAQRQKEGQIFGSMMSGFWA